MTLQTIASWIKRYKETGDYSSKEHLSKARETRFNDRIKVLEYLETNANAGGVAIRDNITADLPMSIFYDALAHMGITYKNRAKTSGQRGKQEKSFYGKIKTLGFSIL